MKFRTLCADEIECRVSAVKTSGISLLLYKNARADMNILDETVGAENWQRSHSRDNANCTVSIWDDQKKQWISKEDTGVESNADADKGKASDSFKRACVNWGIGRELYTAPFIWVPSNKCSITDSGRKDKYGHTVLTCKDKFKVKFIDYDSKKRIISLIIENESLKATVFQCGQSNTNKQNNGYGEKKQSDTNANKKPELSEFEVARLRTILKERAIIENGIYNEVEFCKKNKIKALENMSRSKFEWIIKNWAA